MKEKTIQLRDETRSRGFALAQAAGLGVCAVLGVVLSAGVSVAGTEVTSCGQVVSGSAFLSGDLDCSTSGSDAVVLAGGTLDLRGFTITGDPVFDGCVVRCTRSCQITSTPPGGTVASGTNGVCDDAFDADLVRMIRLKDVIVTGCDSRGVSAQESGVRVINSTVSNIAGYRAVSLSSFDRGRLRVVNSTITNNANGVTAIRGALIRDSVISGNTTFGVAVSRKLRVKNSQIIGNGTYGAGASGKNVFIDSTISGNGEEGINLSIDADKLKVLRTTVDGNGSDGIFLHGVPTLIRDSVITNNSGNAINGVGSKLKVLGATVSDNRLNGINIPGPVNCEIALQLGGSTLTGNGTDASCGVTVTCADVASCAPPSVTPSVCDTSYDTNSGFPGLSWGVCALD